MLSNRKLLLSLLFILQFPTHGFAAGRESPVVAGYVFPQNGPLQVGQIDARALTRINYAFALIKDGRMVEGSEADKQNFTVLTGLRKDNASLKVLVSVGGWLGSGGFSDAALTQQSRAVFVQSAMDFLRLYDLDGLDVDWEYPGQVGAGNHFRAEDQHNFTLLLKDLRAGMTRQEKTMHRRLYLTIAAGAFGEYLAHTEMAEVQRYVDAVSLMSYDYYEASSDKTTGHHAPLYTSPDDPKKESADSAVRAFEADGVPAEKLVLGVPFYGRMWGEVASAQHGLFEPGKPIANEFAPYSRIATTMLGQGFARYWDANAQVPWLYDEEKHVFVSYEDPQSLTGKCEYVLSHKLGGVMFWSYFNDSDGELLKTIDGALRRPVTKK